MNRNWTNGIGALAMLVVVAFESTAWAQSPAPKPVAEKGEWAPILKQLHAAHRLLITADHDYSGHRAKAAEEVHKAIEELAGHHHAKSAQPGSTSTGTVGVNRPAKTGEGHVHEPQGNSDAQLKQAQSILESVQGELSSRHPKAAANVQAAITEITTALSIK
jgi:hypothetical protein